jgi:hypothetical protein
MSEMWEEGRPDLLPDLSWAERAEPEESPAGNGCIIGLLTATILFWLPLGVLVAVLTCR